MGKGAIISSNDDGSYLVTVEYDMTAIAAKIARLQAKASELEAEISRLETIYNSTET